MNAPTRKEIMDEAGHGLTVRMVPAHLVQPATGSETDYRALFETFPHPIWVYDLETLAFLAVNEAAIRASGYSREEYLVMTLRDSHSCNDLTRLAFGPSGVPSSALQTVQGYHRRKDGTLLDAELVHHSISFGGRRAGVVLALSPGEPRRSGSNPRQDDERSRALVEASRDATLRRQMDDALARKTRQLEVLAQATQQINTVLEAPVILRKLVVSAMELTGAAVGTAGRVVQGEMVFSEFNHRGVWITRSSHFGPGYGPAGWVLENWKPCLVIDASQDPLVPPELQQDPRFCCLANVPILDHRGELMGCVELHNPASEHRFDEADVTMLQGLAASAGTALDNAGMIEARRRAEAELRASEARLRLVTDNMVDVISQMGTEGLLEYASPSIQRILGFESRELLGQPAFERVHEEDRRRSEAAILEAAEERRPSVRLEYRHRHGNGHYVWLESEAKLLYDQRGGLNGAIFGSRDVTERKRIESELRQSRERFQFIFQSNPVAIGISTLRDGRYIDVNQSLLRITGYSRDEIIGRTARELNLWTCPEDRALLLQHLREDRAVCNIESRFRTKSGEVRDALESVQIIQLGLDPCLLFIITDITERKRLEEQLRHSQKMDAIGQLAGGVAHDFNNMLTVIQGHANMIGMQENLSASATESVQEISQASERAANLTRQLLTFSRKQPMQARHVDLNEVVGNLTKMLRRIIGEQLSIEFRYSPQLPSVLADVGMIEQALMNLAINARDAMSNGGRLVIGTEVRRVDATQAGGHAGAREGEFVCLVVRDTGAGIPAAILPRIFEPFFTTKELGKGTGLGLATVQNVVQQHGGWIEVESVINSGTTFRVFLPARSQGLAELPDAHLLPVTQGGSETILLVEDEEALRVLARQVLEHYGYDVWEASSGIAALEIWAERADKIHLLFTDVVMPGGLNGKELADRLRSDRPDLKVILTTGYSTEAMRRPPLPRDRMPILHKPYPPQVLAQTVRDCLDQK